MTANAAIYSSTKKVIPVQKLREIVGHDNVSVKRSLAGDVSQILLRWSDCTIAINLMKAKEIPQHLEGFLGYINHLSGGHVDQRLAQLMQQVADTKQVMGLVIEPGLDTQGRCKRFVCVVTNYYGGIFFANDSIYDGNGILLLGPERAVDY